MGALLVIEHEATGERRRHVRGRLRIGRASDNDWVLPDRDPKPSLSRRHCVIEGEGDAFTVLDLASTNGTRLNGRSVPPRLPTPLGAGDRLELGRHILRLSLESERPAMDAGSGATLLPGVASAIPAWQPPARPAGRSLDTLLGGLAQADPFATAGAPAEGPVPAVPEDEDPLGGLFRETPPPVSRPLPPGREVGHTAGDHTQPQLEAFAVPTSRLTPPIEAKPAGSQAYEAFLAGAGLASGEVQGEPERLMRAAGEAFAALASGLRELLATRALVKGQAGVTQTMIGAVDNNPLRHAVGRAEAVRALLAPREAGFLEPQAAIAVTLDDLKAHELALLEGVQAALAALLAQFDPTQLERRLEDASTLQLLLHGGRRAKLWQLYVERYEAIAEAARIRFMGDMDRAFVAAYERKVRELRLRSPKGESRR